VSEGSHLLSDGRRKYYTPAEVAAYLGLSRSTVYPHRPARARLLPIWRVHQSLTREDPGLRSALPAGP
jgi:hypothetical protein